MDWLDPVDPVDPVDPLACSKVWFRLHETILFALWPAPDRPWLPRRPEEAAWAPHTWLLMKKGSIFGEKKPPEAAWTPHTWLLKCGVSFFGEI